MNREDTPQISPSEWEVMTILWEAVEPLTSTEIIERLRAVGANWADKTIYTFLARLTEKGAVSTIPAERGRGKLYQAAVQSDKCVYHEAKSFLNRVFRGEPGPMLMHFLQHEALSATAIAELKQLLNKKS